MPPRSLLLLLLGFLVVAALLGAALWVAHEDAPLAASEGGARSGGQPLASAGEDAAEAPLPAAPAPAEELLRAPEPLEPGSDPPELVRAQAALASGEVRGRLVDEQGAGVGDEPVALLLVRDPWSRGLQSSRQQAEVLSRARSDASGGFRLAARPGAEHALLAGGARHPRCRVEAVASGDELLVELEAPRAIAGFVREQETGEGLAGASVVALAGSGLVVALTDGDGAFRLEPLGSPAVLVAALAEGFDVVVADDPPAWEQELLLDLPPGRTLRGTVVEQDSGAPIAGAEVVVRIDPASWLELPEAPALPIIERRARTDGLGRFELEGLSSVGFLTTVSAEGYVPHRFDRHVDRALDPEAELELRLSPLTLLTGQVVAGEELLPVAGAAIAVLAGDVVLAHAQSDAEGRFEAGLEAWDGEGPLVVEARDDLGRRARVHGKLQREQELVLELVLPVSLPVLVLAAGAPLAGAQVAAFSEDGTPTLGVSGGDGQVTLVHALAGAGIEFVRLQARHGGRESLPVIVELSEGRSWSEPWQLDLDAGEWVVGSVSDVSGQPIPSARVALRKGPCGHTDAEGAFRLGPLETEQDPWRRLTVEAEGYRVQKLEVLSDGVPVEVVLLPVVSWQGRVVDTSTGRAPEHWAGVLEVEVEQEGRRVFTRAGPQLVADHGEPGAFSVTLPGEGRFRILVEALDAIAVTSASEFFDGLVPPPYAELLVFPAAILELQIADDAGRPVEGYGLDVIAWERAGDADRPSRGLRRTGRSARTDEDGRVRLNLGEGGAFRIAGGGSTWLEHGRLVVPPGPAIERRYTVGPSGDLHVTVVDARGATVVPAKLSLRTSDRAAAHAVSRSTRTSSRTPDGVTFETVPAGSYRVSVKAKGFLPVQRPVEVAAGRVQHLDLTLLPVTDGGGQAAAGGGRR